MKAQVFGYYALQAVPHLSEELRAQQHNVRQGDNALAEWHTFSLKILERSALGQFWALSRHFRETRYRQPQNAELALLCWESEARAQILRATITLLEVYDAASRVRMERGVPVYPDEKLRRYARTRQPHLQSFRNVSRSKPLRLLKCAEEIERLAASVQNDREEMASNDCDTLSSQHKAFEDLGIVQSMLMENAVQVQPSKLPLIYAPRAIKTPTLA